MVFQLYKYFRPVNLTVYYICYAKITIISITAKKRTLSCPFDSISLLVAIRDSFSVLLLFEF